MANIDMKTLTIGENTYIIIDAGARTLIGDLSNLDTTAKNNLVAAINEIFNSGSSITVDSALSSSSENPVQNKVINSALNLKAPLASPTFTGTPTAPTPTTSDNSTRIATTEYVKQNIPTVPSAYSSNPAMDGTASAGSSSSYAKGDHVHPHDTSKIDMPSGGSTGQVLKKTANGVEWANESGGGTTEIFWATFGTTTNAQIETAYSAGKMVFAVDSSDNVAILEEITTGEDYALFTSYHNSNMVVWQCENDTWTSSSKLIPSAYTSNPAMDGTASAGSSTSYAKGDHVHPSDTNKADKVTVVTVSDAGAVTQALDAGKIYDFTGTLTSLTITLNAATAPAQYHFRFDSGSPAPTLTLPNTVTMPSGFQVEANKHYEIDIVDGYGLAASWATS